MRCSTLGGSRLPILFGTEQGEPIRFFRKILVVALLVGSCQAVGAQAAYAPHESISILKHPKIYAKMRVTNRVQFACLDRLWTQESHWNAKALNHSSGAFGIAQFLPTTWGNYNFEFKPTSPIKQIDYGLHYISKRYGSPCKAWKHEQKFGWY